MTYMPDCIDAVKSSRTTPTKAAGAALARARKDTFGAWAALVPAPPEATLPAGPLAGVSVGVKDLFPVAGLPMRVGTSLVNTAPSMQDAALVAALREAGAAIIGTTSMPEFSLGVTPGAKNPRDIRRTPGSSSSGSAIAVAAGQVPLTLAMQTNASIIRPASFCGVAAFKPTQGVLSTQGAFTLAPSLDQPGFMAATRHDLALVFAALAPAHTLKPVAQRGTVAFMRTPLWNQASLASRKHLEALAKTFDAEEILLPEQLCGLWQWLDCIMETELAQNLAAYQPNEKEMKPPMQRALARGRGYSAETRRTAKDGRKALQDWGREHLARFDCIITPAASGPAPLLEDGAGSPVFSTIWSLMGAPCLCLPAFTENTLPVGVQLVGAPGSDAGLLHAAIRVEQALAAPCRCPHGCC